MGHKKLLSLLLVAAIVLLGCNIGATPTAAPLIISTSTLATRIVGLTVQAANANDPFNAVGQVIHYRYTVSNTGVVPLAGPVTVASDKMTIACPGVNSVGNLDNNLDAGESIICTADYAITDADLISRSVTTNSTASVSGFNSDPVATTVTFAPLSTLKLTKTASPLTYNQAGQSITFTFVIQNISTAAIGPTQFTITDNRLGAPISCGPAATTLAPQQSISCTATYTTTQADLSTGSIVNSATASGGGTNVSAAATTTVSLSSSPPGLTRGSTIQHRVSKGEWMIQIARCYGASYTAMRTANPQIGDPDVIDPDITVTVPNIGSNGTIYGPPCVGQHTVQSGDTWNSIAQRYNADPTVLQAANPKGMAVGTVLKIPLNSAGSSIPAPTLTPTLTSNPTPTFTPSPTSTQGAQATRITFPAGSSSTTVNGSVAPEGTVRYVLTAAQGQVLVVNATVPANEVAVTITGPNGAAINPLSANSLSWNVTLPASGDYIIQIDEIAGTGSKPYSLTVTLSTP